MLNIHVGDLVMPLNWPYRHISLDDHIGNLVQWNPGTGLGIIVEVIPVNGNFGSQWVKVFSSTAIGWCFSCELEIIE